MNSKPPPPKRPKIQPIETGTILSDASLDDYLIGTPPSSRSVNPDLHDGLVAIATFLRRHQFLSSSSSSVAAGHEHDQREGDGAVAASSTGGLSSRIYGPVIEEFTKAQMDRQAAGLRTNTSGASAAAMKKVVDCHTKALQHGLDSIATNNQDPSSWLTRIEANLNVLHSKLCPEIMQSGRYRGNRVRASNTQFIPPENIREEMDALFSVAAVRLQSKWASSSTAIMDEQQWCEHVYRKIAIAAIVLFGINDIHPFQDGNGRAARIYMNVALKKLLGLPFPIIITATAPQRREYVDGLRESRSRLQRIAQKSSRTKKANSPVFRSLIQVVFDRIIHAIRQVNSLIETKSQAAAVEEEAKIARRVRERAAAGQCVICLDDNPNISTLCCGQVVHMTCLAEWLSNHGSCITCRKPLPKLTQRIQRRDENRDGNAGANDPPLPPADGNALRNVNEETEESTEETTAMDDTTTDDDANDANDADAHETTEDTTTMDDTTNDAEDDNADAAQDDTTEDVTEDTTTVDDTTNDDNDDVQEDNTEDTTEDATEDTTEDSDDISDGGTATEQQQTTHQTIWCGHCQKNRFALDCSNGMCGSCCQLYGTGSCDRHNVY
mmetsp:Transcript_22461/g.47287  ORF Transcript_22461/g.47287 Transcript_22461/m.47287 type:complete len:609 (+) Transcript_22461:88-1914(+)